MSKVLIAYFSEGGITGLMAQYIGEGIRIKGHEAVTREVGKPGANDDLALFAGFIFGSPTYSLDAPGEMKDFLASLDKDLLKGKPGGAFGSYTHDVSYEHENLAPAIILDLLESYGMKRFELGSLILRENMVESTEGMRACQQYGEEFARKLPGVGRSS